MIITVAEIIAKLHEQRKTCVLTFQIEKVKHLLKFYFSRGEIRQVSFGDKKNADCLPLIRECTFEKYSFIEDVDTHILAAGLRPEEILDYVKTIDRTVAAVADTVYGQSVKVEALGPDAVREVETAFVEAVGPVAPILLDDCLKKIGYPKGAQLSKGTLKLIVGMLSEELPEKERPGFLRKFRM